MRRLVMALALGCLSTAGHAANYLITYTGTVSSGTDVTGVFGPAGASLAGASFSAVYSLDYPAAGATDTTDSGLHKVYGGTAMGTTSPVSATFTLNGITQSVSGSNRGEIDKADNYYGYDMLTAIADDTNSTSGITHADIVYSSISSNTNNITDSTDLGELLSYAAAAGDNPVGYFQFWGYDQATNTEFMRASGYLVTQAVTVAAAPVPEPATWAMMVGGFGMIGGALRRRSVRLTFA